MTQSENELLDFEQIVAALWYVTMCERSGVRLTRAWSNLKVLM